MAGLAILLLLGVSAVRVLFVRHELAQRVGNLQTEIRTLEDEGVALQRDLDWVRSAEGVERLARQQLGWAKPGESAVVVAGLATPQPSPTPTSSKRAPSTRGLWDLLFGPQD